ncbi:hypothetical protein SAMN02745857_00879 [Andreprevotia lacus DSM 23236]|jgi:hypothetical protein|uniref:Tail sheath protein C-terminal domain-containing protein n=1 Tax=Andreprevotia lacus DSM 23236 TaxID=1121001 RepID=A0A1W1X8D3_9NEIS|nr:phage tail sheath C-terminal domain-containing protein [Andreprevotia lacus]SMC20232.1 hypothetical protein SAMN02745857_00879 [Andreprevotia lacus DSM 23236]
MPLSLNTPGTYINEINGFPDSVVPVATAVPAFIGYLPRADYGGKSYYGKPVRISSLAEFAAYFLLPDPPAPADPVQQYSPQYYLLPQAAQPACGEYLQINGQFQSVLPDPDTIYQLYNAVRWFYANGGGTAYIVAVGPYGPPSGLPLTHPVQRAVNGNIRLADLLGGLQALNSEEEPTLYLCPDAVQLSDADNAAYMQAALLQASTLGSCMCLLDVPSGHQPEPQRYALDIAAFRHNTGQQGLDYGAAYYPYVTTSVMQPGEIDFTNLFGGDASQLLPLLNPPSAPNADAAGILAQMQLPAAQRTQSNSQLNNALVAASPVYAQILTQVTAVANTLPPASAMAGVYTVNDADVGVWHSPANVGLAGAVALPVKLSDAQHAELNVDAVSGKSIDAIRAFAGQGILVWGARTLDGNSQDWRYVSVRRTIIMVEQSIKLSLRAFAFSPNDANTWAAVKSMIDSYLTVMWEQGGLQGAKPTDAFSVAVGLGSTMTADDILNGYMQATVQVAVVHPAEFIVMSFKQQMAQEG